jgi:hypothetical protein
MKSKRWWAFLVVIIVALLVFDAPVYSFNDTPKSRETLQGVAPIYVVIEGITPVLEQNGMSARQLKADMESQLRKAGIPVSTTRKGKDTAGSFPGGLHVRINALKSNMLKSEFYIDYYAISISVELIQRCLPLTNNFISRASEKDIGPSYLSSHSASACTWSTNNIYLAGEKRITAIQDCVRELVGHFIKAYVFVNSKR